MVRSLTAAREVIALSLAHIGCWYDLLPIGLLVRKCIMINDIKLWGLETAVGLNVPCGNGMYYE